MRRLHINILLVATLLFCLSSCASVKPAGVKSGPALYVTFYTGDAGTQYFIKPLTFNNSLNEELKVDLTFIYKNKLNDSATLNISYLGNQLLKGADSLKIETDFTSVKIKEINFMFSERSKKMYNCRFSAKVNLADLPKLFANKSWNIIVFNKGEYVNFSTPNSTSKKIDKLNYQIFSIVK